MFFVVSSVCCINGGMCLSGMNLCCLMLYLVSRLLLCEKICSGSVG